MARLVHYQISYSSTGTAAGAGDILLVKGGKIKGVTFRGSGLGGAGGGYMSVELTVNQGSNSFAASNNPLRVNSVAAASYAFNNASVGFWNAFIPSDWPVTAGDRLFANQTQTGTAPSTNNALVDIYVQEE